MLGSELMRGFKSNVRVEVGRGAEEGAREGVGVGEIKDVGW